VPVRGLGVDPEDVGVDVDGAGSGGSAVRWLGIIIGIGRDGGGGHCASEIE
jgi:hypothetical protein